jgi:hypothetical protein
MAAEPTQYMFKHKDLVAALIRAQNLREGLWQLTFNFGFGAANIGPTPEDSNPTAFATIISVGLQRVEQITNPAFTLDAATINNAA